MMKLLMKCLLFAGAMATVGCTDEKTEEILVRQPNSFRIGMEGDESFALNIPSGDKIGINGREVQVLSNGLVSLYEVPAEEKYTVYYPCTVQLQGERMKFDMPQEQTYKEGAPDVTACPYYTVTDNEGLVDLKLKPVLGALKLTIPANQEFASVSSVILESESDDIMAGRMELDLTNGDIVARENMSRKVVLKGNIDITAGSEVSIVLPPQTFTGKLDVTLIAPKGGGTYSLDLTGKSIEAGKVLTAPLDNIDWKMRTYYYGTSNCVVVRPGQFSATVNCAAHYTTSPVYAYENIPAEDDYLPCSAAQLWNDVSPDFVKRVTLAQDRKSFTVNLGGQPGNAVIAIYDKEDPKAEDAKILWSFHIWVTEIGEQSLGMNAKGNSYTVLDRNLGATSVTPGDLRSIGLLYQWGRKDPFVGPGEYGKNSNAKMYNEVGEVAFTTVKGGESTGNVKYAVENPTKFIMYSRSKSNTSVSPYYCAYDWLYYADWALWGNPEGYTYPKASDLTKSIYDPSPEGYMVSPNDTWIGSDDGYDKASSVFATAEWSNGYTVSGTDGQNWWYPIGGWRSRKNGKLTAANTNGYYWCSSTDREKAANAIHLTLGKDGVKLNSNNSRANSSLIRCVKIDK